MSRRFRFSRRKPPSGRHTLLNRLSARRKDSVTSVPPPVRRGKGVAPGVGRLAAEHHRELEHLARDALGDLALRPVGGADLVALHVAAIPRADGGSRGPVEPLGFEDLRAVLAHPGDVAHQLPHPKRFGVDVQGHGGVHGGGG